MPLIKEIWADGHPNAGASLHYTYYGRGDDANFFALNGEAMGYRSIRSIRIRSDFLETIIEDGFPWLKKYGVLTTDFEDELKAEWEQAFVKAMGKPFKVQYRTRGVGAEWTDARDATFDEYEAAEEHLGRLAAVYAAGGTEYRIWFKEDGDDD